MRCALTTTTVLVLAGCHVDASALGEGGEDTGAAIDATDGGGVLDVGVDGGKAETTLEDTIDAGADTEADVTDAEADADIEPDALPETDAAPETGPDTFDAGDASDGGCGTVNLLANAGFEAPAITANTKVYSNDAAFLPSWSLHALVADGTNRFWVENGVLPSVGFSRHVEGTQSICLNGDGIAMVWVEQSFATTPGARYRISFSLTDEKAAGPSECAIQVDVVGKTFVFPRSGDTGWKVDTVDFTATSSTTTVRFTDATPASAAFNSPILDDVSVVDCP